MARRAADNGLVAVSSGYLQGAHDAHRQAQSIRSVLFSADNGAGGGSEARDERNDVQSVSARAAAIRQTTHRKPTTRAADRRTPAKRARASRRSPGSKNR
jgi:hypothetical protein